MALTGRAGLLAAVGALLVGLLIPSWTGVAFVELALLTAILYDLARAAPVHQLQFTRSGDTSVRVGEQASVDLLVSNPSGRPLHCLLRDAWPPSCWPAEDRQHNDRHRMTVPPGERRRVTTQLHPVRRGNRHADRITVRSFGPLGLAARQGTHARPWTLRVLPAFPARKHLPAKLARLRELDGRTSILTRGNGTEFDSLREYVPGDDTRSIDWRATARTSNVAVRTWRPERDRHILIVLDTGRTSAGRVGDIPRLDASMDAALLLAALASRAGDQLGLLAYDREPRAVLTGKSSTNVLPALVDAMAPLDPALVETDARGMVSTALRAAPHRSLIVLLTSLEPAAVEQGMLPMLPVLTKKHTVLVAAVSDPRLQELEYRRGTVEAVYGAAAAAQARSERTATADRLRSYGATVVDSLPTDIAPELADTYLSLKASGRL